MADDHRNDFGTESPTAEQASNATSDPLIGFVINGVYEIRDRIDAGGMGVVYLAWDLGLHKFVAVKTLRERLLAGEDGADSMEEAARQARIDHPAFVAVMHASTFEHPDGERCAFFVMEYVKGAHPLLNHARAKSLSVEERVALFIDACEAVRHLHEREDLIHFDLKNANVLVDDRGRVRVIDLGVARAHKDHDAETPGGTITCMSPEHIRGRVADLDHRCDIWSLGVLLYMLLSDGQAPFVSRDRGDGADRMESLKRSICEDDPPRLHVDAALWRVVERALAKSPSDRYESVGAMINDLYAATGLTRAHVETAPMLKSDESVLRRRLLKGAVAALIAAASVLIAIPLTPLLATEWTNIQPAFGRWLLQPASVGPSEPLSQTAIIAFADSTDAESVAGAAGVDGVSNREVVSHRRLHGALCERLIAADVSAVVFDIVFRSQTEHDEDFAAGIKALQDAGVGVVVAAPQWTVDAESQRPVMSERLWEEGVGWGCYALQEIGGQLAVPLVVKRGEVVMPSLPLAGFAAGRADGASFSVSLDEGDGSVGVRYWRLDSVRPDVRRAGPPPDLLELTSVEKFDPTTPRIGPSMGYRSDDVIGMYFAATLNREAMDAVTYPYESVFEASDTELRQRFSNRVVIVGNSSQAGRDLHAVGDEIWPGVYLQAAATESLLRRHRARAPRESVTYGIAGVSAFFGALAGFRMNNSRRDRHRSIWRSGIGWVIVLVIALAVLMVTSVLTFRALALFWSPFFPVTALAVAAACAIVAARLPWPVASNSQVTSGDSR